MNNHKRRQLALFADKKAAKEIEDTRKRFNPEQYRLIDAHVTLCREDEIEDIAIVLDNLEKLDSAKIRIQFGQATKFDNGLGVLLPALGDNEQFHQLRLKVLNGLGTTVHRHQPHITLMHPRNSICTDEIFRTIRDADFPKVMIFEKISLIEQGNGGKWQTLKTYTLKYV